MKGYKEQLSLPLLGSHLLVQKSAMGLAMVDPAALLAFSFSEVITSCLSSINRFVGHASPPQIILTSKSRLYLNRDPKPNKPRDIEDVA